MLLHESNEPQSKQTHPGRPAADNLAPQEQIDSDGQIRSSPTNPLSNAGGIARLQRLAGNRAVASYMSRGSQTGRPKAISQPTVQREVNKKGTFPNWGGTSDGSVTVNPNAAIDVVTGDKKISHPAWFIKEATESVEVEPGATGTVRIRLPWYWHHHGIVQEPGKIYGTNEKHIRTGGGPIDWWVDAEFTVAQDGKVTISAPAPGGVLGALGYLDATPTITTTPRDADGLGSVMVSVAFKALQATTTTDTGTRTTTGGGSGTVAPGGVGGGVIYNVSEASSHAVGVTLSGATAVTCSFGINLKVKMPPKIEKKKSIMYDAEGKFVSGNDGIKGVYEWWGTIPASIREMIVAGKKPVRITGRASATGTEAQNETVILNRKEDVKTRLTRLASKMVIHDDSDFTAFNERSVVIRVEYTASEEKAGAGTPAKP